MGALLKLQLRQRRGQEVLYSLWREDESEEKRFTPGDLTSAASLADQVVDFGQREGSHTSLAFAHQAQVQVRFYRGDLVGVEKHFAVWKGFRQALATQGFPIRQ
jgi:hypothetical protein